MSYYLFHITNVEETTKVYKFDTDNLKLIFKYIMRKWGKSYLKFIKYAQIDTQIGNMIPKSILKFVNSETEESDMINMVNQIDTKDILKLFRIPFFASRKFYLDSYENNELHNMANEMYKLDYIHLEKLYVEITDIVINLHREYDFKDSCNYCNPLNSEERLGYCKSTLYDIEYFDVVCKIIDIETLYTCSIIDIKYDPDEKERIEFIDNFQDFLTIYESDNLFKYINPSI